MKVFRVFNGYMGYSAVHRIVLAHTPQQALTKAKPMFKQWSDRSGVAEEVDFDEHGVEREERD